MACPADQRLDAYIDALPGWQRAICRQVRDLVHAAIREGEAVNAPAPSAMFRQIIANNRAGGWRKLKQERP
jgi:hypothetical protein